jgi:hypothetical protein
MENERGGSLLSPLVSCWYTFGPARRADRRIANSDSFLIVDVKPARVARAMGCGHQSVLDALGCDLKVGVVDSKVMLKLRGVLEPEIALGALIDVHVHLPGKAKCLPLA